MGVRVIAGRSGSGKTRLCIEEIVKRLNDSADTGKLILLVPEQATYQMEKAILERCESGAYHRLYVLSFSRLRYWLSGETKKLEPVSKTGKRLLLMKIIEENKGSLKLLSSGGGLSMLADDLGKLFREFGECDISGDDLSGVKDSAADIPEYTRSKYAEIAFAYQKYMGEVARLGLDDSDVAMRNIIAEINKSDFFDGASVWLDSFSGFTAVEMKALEAICRKAACCSITLCADPADADNPVFEPSNNTFTELKELLGAGKVEYLTEIHRWDNGAASLAALEEQLAADKDLPKDSMPELDAFMHRAGNEYDEVQAVACEICRLRVEEGYSFEDVGIVAPDIADYSLQLETIFADFGIPLFIDKASPLINEPFARLVVSALELALDGFSYEPLSAWLKNPCSPVPLEEALKIEKLLRETAPSKSARQRLISGYKACKALTGFAAAFDSLKGEKALVAQVRDIVSALLNAKPAGDYAGYAEESERVTKIISELFDEMAVITGSEDGGEEDVRLLLELLRSDLLGRSLGKIPATTSQVVAGDIRRTRKPDLKALFILGATREKFPYPGASSTLLSKYERKAAPDLPLKLAEEERMAFDKYLTYIALTRASQRLYVSLPEGPLPAEFAVQLETAGAKKYGDSQALYLPEAVLERKAADMYSTGQLSAEPLAALGETSAPVRGTNYTNKVNTGSEDVAGFHKGDSQLSVSRLQDYAQCPFKFFANSILGLRAEKACEFSALVQGVANHGVIDIISQRLIADGKGFEDVSEKEICAMLDDAFSEYLAADKTLKALSEADEHGALVVSSFKEILRNLLLSLRLMALDVSFKLDKSEYEFGEDNPLVLYKDSERTITLHGKIDRIDKGVKGEVEYSVCYDYKYSEHKVEKNAILYGWDIQLPLYVKALQHAGLNPVGFFYQASKKGSSEKLVENEGDGEKFHVIKTRGHLDQKYVMEFGSREAGEKSEFFQIARTATGKLHGSWSNSVMVTEDYSTVLDYAFWKACDMVKHIFNGEMDVAPLDMPNDKPCSQCDFASICRFEDVYNERRELEKLETGKMGEFADRLREEMAK